MPLPLIPIALVGATGVIGYFILDSQTGKLEQIAEDALEDGQEFLEMTIAELESIVGNLGASLLEVLEGAGVAVLKGVQNTCEYVADQVAERRVPAVAVAWAMLIYAITAVTIYNRVKKA